MKKGFTLVELLAVVVILAIILAIAIPTITGLIEQSKKNSFDSSVKLLIKTAQMKVLENSLFDLSTIHAGNVETLLGIEEDNYASVYIRNDIDGKYYAHITGKGNWEGLEASGSYENINIHPVERIVTNDVILHYDASNTASYPGSGTAWYDLSGNNNKGLLVNGPSFSPVDGGAIVCDGTNDYMDLPIPSSSSLSTITVEGFIKWNSSNNGMFLGMNTYDVYTYAGALGYNNGASNVIGISAETVTSLGLVGNYKHYAFVMNKTGLLTTNKIYINGILQSMTVVRGLDGNIPGFNNNLRLCSWNNTGFYGNFSFGNIRVYNRELTVTEVQQNYNAQKARYGI